MAEREDSGRGNTKLGKRRRRSSTTFQLSGMSADVERKWCRVAPVQLRASSKVIHPRVRCLSLDRTYVTEDFVADLFSWPDADRAAEQLRDSIRFPEMLLITATARDNVRLAELGVIEPDEEIVLLTVRGIALAFRALEAQQRELDRTGNWPNAAKAALRKLAALQKYTTAERPPTDAESRRAPRRMLPPVDISTLSEDADPEKELPALKRKRGGASRSLVSEMKKIKMELDNLQKEAEKVRGDVDEMNKLVEAEGKGSSTAAAPE